MAIDQNKIELKRGLIRIERKDRSVHRLVFGGSIPILLLAAVWGPLAINQSVQIVASIFIVFISLGLLADDVFVVFAGNRRGAKTFKKVLWWAFSAVILGMGASDLILSLALRS